MVRAENVHKAFGHLEVLKGIDFDVRPGEVSVVVGPSGSGKSTFLRCINHLEKINAGRIWVDGDLDRLPTNAVTGSTRCATGTSPASADRSAWCSSASTCFRT